LQHQKISLIYNLYVAVELQKLSQLSHQIVRQVRPCVKRKITVQQFFNRVLQRSSCDPNHLDLPLLLRHLEDNTHRGREERFPEDSAVAEALEQVASLDQDHEDLPHNGL
jgi:hypothetical protein